MTDFIHIRGLRLRTRIGVADWEKRDRQDVVIDARIGHDQSRAAASDDLADTVDYKGIRDDLVSFVEGARFDLLEALAEAIAARVLAVPGVVSARITVDKPGALRFADSVAVEIERHAT